MFTKPVMVSVIPATNIILFGVFKNMLGLTYVEVLEFL
jgi:hypothetical protein